MSFSVSLCLTNTNSQNLGTTLKVYTNPISTTNPGTFLIDVLTTSVTAPNCPYTLTSQVPDGTTSIRLYSPSTNCYVDIPVSNNNVCVTCNLDFASISTNQLSTIYVGNLTGSCDTVIDNYRIGWYGPNNPSRLAFTSGFGNIWNYNAKHPITSTSNDAPFLLSGQYISKITEVELNGRRFSSTGGTNNILSPTLTGCTDTVTVVSYTCDNGDNINNPPYTHTKRYQTDGSSLPPPLSAEFKLSANTDYFIWEFSGDSVYDTLKLDFIGSSYTVPINLENISVGLDIDSDNFNVNVFPKLARKTFFKKITTLKNLNVNTGDSIIINVTPNPLNRETNWVYKFGCSNTPTANKSCLDSYRDRPYKIKKDSITATVNACGIISFRFSVSGCSISDNSTFVNSPLMSLTNTLGYPTYISTDNITKLLTLNVPNLTFGTNSQQSFSNNFNHVCMNTPGNTISVEKTTNEFIFEFSSIDDLRGYYNSFITVTNNVKNINTTNGTFIDDPTLINYYRAVSLKYPTNSNFKLCGDGDTYPPTDIYIHCNAICTTGTTVGGGYRMSIQTMSFQYSYIPLACEIPSFTNFITSELLKTRNLIFNKITNTSGLRLTFPFIRNIWATRISSTPNTTQSLSSNLAISPTYGHNTYAASGTTNVLIPSLSGTTWDWQNHFNTTTYQGIFDQQTFSYLITITSSFGQPLTYTISARQISNFQAIGIYTKVYDSVTGVSDPIYVY